jgi:hypothetical protein
MVEQAQKSLDNNLDYFRLLFVMRELWKEQKTKERKERRWNRAAKQGNRANREERLMQREQQAAAEGWGLAETTKPVGEKRKKRDRVETELG